MPNPFFGIADHIWTALTMDTLMSNHLMCKTGLRYSMAAVHLYNGHCLRHRRDLQYNMESALWLQAEESAIALRENLKAIMSARFPEFRNHLPDAANDLQERWPELLEVLPVSWNFSV